MQLKPILLLSILAAACSNADFHGASVGARSGAVDEAAADSDAYEKPDTRHPASTRLKNRTKTKPKNSASVHFSLSQQTTETPDPKDLEIVFLIDNSASMTNKMERLKKSLNAMIAQISGQIENKVNFSFVKLSDYLASYSGVDKFNDSGSDFFVPTNLLFRAVGYMWQYSKVPEKVREAFMGGRSYKHLFIPDVASTDLTQMQASLTSFMAVNEIANEPLISAATEFINFRSFSDSPSAKRFDHGGMVHILSLSDEDNDLAFARGDGGFVSYQTDHYYASVPSVKLDSCARANLYAQGEEGTIYQAKSRYYCRKPDGLADSEVINTQRVSSLKCTSPLMQDPLWTKSKKYIVASTEQSAVSLCKVIPQWTCTRNVDGVEVSSDVPMASTLKTAYSSCVPKASPMITDIFNTDLASWTTRLLASAPTECQPYTCETIVKPVNYVFNKDSTGQVISITEDACAAPFVKVDLGSAFNMIAASFCSKQMPAATRTSAPSTLTFASIYSVPSVAQNRSFYINVRDPGTKEEVFNSFKNQLVQEQSADTTYDIDHISVLNEPSLPRQSFTGTPQGFLDFMRVVHPEKKVVWHSIGSFNDNACPGEAATSGDVKRGASYFTLSEATGGVVGNICDTSFDSIFSNLGKKIISSVLTLNYDLAAVSGSDYQDIYKTATVKSVYNETQNKPLPLTAYSYENGTILLNKSAGKVNDMIRVDFEY